MTRIGLSIVAFLVLFGGSSTLAAQTVAEDVLKSKDLQGIEFKSYVGPHRVVETRMAIQGIGVDLGRQMKVAGATQAVYGKYRVVRLHDPASDRLSADLFILDPGTAVDHIRNLNWIVSSYLQQAFGYSAADGDLLANFVTRYNAFYRGNLEYFQTMFIPQVGANVTKENAGIALTYTEWPGKTRMIIPLRDSLSKGLGGSINTEEISNKAVVTQMAEEPGAGLDDRKKLADLKEAEIVQEQKAVAAAEAKVPTGPTTPGTATPGPTSTTPPTTPAGPATAPTTPGQPAATTTTTPAAAEQTKPALPLEEAKKDLEARDQALQAERQAIVEAETKQPAEPAAPVAVKPALTVAFVKMAEATKTGQLWLVDPAANKVWKTSELNSIRQLDTPVFGPGLLVVAGDARAATGAIRLVLLSKDDASVLVTGSDDVAPETPLVAQGNQMLALTKGAGSGWVLGLFDQTLKAVVKGTDPLSATSAIVPTPQGILVQGASGKLLLLDPATLKKKSDTEG